MAVLLVCAGQRSTLVLAMGVAMRRMVFCFLLAAAWAAPGLSSAQESQGRVCGPMTMGAIPCQSPADSRMPPISPDNYTAAQRKAVDAFLHAHKTPVFGPFEILLRNPDLMTMIGDIALYVRFNQPAIGMDMAELVILMTAREWGQDYQWSAHAPIAAKQGIKQEVIDAIADGRRPAGMREDEAVVYDMVNELNRHHRVSDETYARVVNRFGERGVVDITCLAGYYTLLAITMNTARMPVPADKRLPRFPN